MSFFVENKTKRTYTVAIMLEFILCVGSHHVVFYIKQMLMQLKQAYNI